MKASLKKTTKTFSNNKVNNTRLRFSMKNVILLFILILLISLVLYPLLVLVIKTLLINGKLNLKSILQAFDAGALRSITNTIVLAGSVLITTWVIGGSLAFIVVKTDYKYKKLVDFFAFLTFTIPSYILGVSWIQLTSKNGYLVRLVKLFNPNFSTSIKTYSLTASVIVLAVHLAPLVYFGIKNALIRMGDTFINSAKVSGISKVKIIFTIVLPLMLPTLISTGLLVFSRSMANFGVVAQLALPAGKEVMTISIFSALHNQNLQLVCILSLLLMFISLTIYHIMEHIANNKKYIYDYAENVKPTTISLGKRKIPIHLLITSYFSLTIVIPLVTILVSSFTKRWGVDLVLKNFTFNNYLKVFSGEVALGKALLNSLSYGMIASLLAVVLTSFILYMYKNYQNKAIKLSLTLAQLPIAIPNMILAIAAIFAWNKYPIKFYGTKWIIIITYTVLFIPIILKQTQGLVNNMDNNCENSARTLGITFWKRYWYLYMPQVKNTLIAGFLACLLISFREIPISLLLHTKTSKTLGVMLFNIQSNSYGLEMTSTVAVITILLSIITSFTVQKLNAKVSERHGVINKKS